MEITCPNCQKKYSINQTQLPSVVKAAKCKACNQLIPLNSASLAPPGGQAAVIETACRYCGRKYRLCQNKVPSHTKSFKCKSCGHPVPLMRQAGSATAHLLKKETSNIASLAPESKPSMAESGQKDILVFSCAGCGKKYKIPHNRIPPKITAVKCKSCGRRISLQQAGSMPPTADYLKPQAQQVAPSAAKSDPTPAEKPAVIRRSRKLKWLVALAAGLALVAVWGTLAHRELLDWEWLNQLLPGHSEQATEAARLLENEPFLVLNLNVPLLLGELENRLEPDKYPPRLQKIMAMLAAMDLKQVDLYLYSTDQDPVLPVILAYGGSRRQFENILTNQDPFKNYLKRRSAGRYRLKKEALDDAQKYKVPLQSYEVSLIDGGIALAPTSLSGAIRKNPKILTSSRIARFTQSVATPLDLASFAVHIPADINREGIAKFQNNPAMQSVPQAAMIAGMGSAIASELSGSLKSLELLALGFRYSGRNERTLTYAQQFRPEVDGENIYRRLAAENLANPEIDGIIRNLIELFQNHRYRHTLNFKDNRLDLKFSWSAQDDEVFLTALSTATIGQLLAGSMELTSSPGAVETRYVLKPDLVSAVDVDRLKTGIPHIMGDCLFPGDYRDSGDHPTMTLDLDTLDIPNAALAELTYAVKSIQTIDGKDVLETDKREFKPRLQPGSLFPGSITLNIKKDTAPETLGKAVIEFHLFMPAALQIFNFKIGANKGSIKEVDGIRVTLDRLEKDVARVSSNSGKSIRLIAYDQSGNALASKESMYTSSSASARFQGIIDMLKVAVIRDMLEYPFEVEVDLNGGKALALAREAEIPSRIRYNHYPVPSYVDFTAEDIQNLSVTWNEGRQDAWNDSLSIKLPGGPFSGTATWEVHFFGTDKPRMLTGNSVRGDKEVSYILGKDSLKQVSAAFGKVQLNLHSDIKRLTFFRKDGMQPDIQKVPSGDEVSVVFNKNEIAYSIGKAEVIQTAAYDARDNRLKEDPYTRNKADRRLIYFWGVPAKFVIDVSMKTIKKIVPFEIKQRQLDEKSYLANRQLIENQREVVQTIKAIDRARRSDRSYYGDDLAGLYYLYDQKKGSPMKLISQEVAHSDPAGQKRFGYRVEPYKGYFFTVLSGVETNGTNKGYSRRLKKSSFTWQNGTITTTALTRHPDLAAIPEDSSQPTFFLQWGQVFMKPLNGKNLEYLPDGYYNNGWVEAKFIDN